MNSTDLENLTPEQLQIIDFYSANEMYELKRICYPLICRKGVPTGDHDDLYSLASYTLLESIVGYDESKQCSFRTYLIGNIQRSFYDWSRDSWRGKRCNIERDENGRIKKDKNGKPIIIPDIYLNDKTKEGAEIGEMIDSGFRVEDKLSEGIGTSSDNNIQNYMKSLTSRQKEIAQLLIQGYKPETIRERLGLTENRYLRCISFMKKPEKRRLLEQKYHINAEEDKQMETQTRERSKEKQYSISSLIKKIDGYTFRFDHPTQRESGRWSSKMKGNLISDILQNNPLPHLIFAEQIINGIAVTWNLDGKQKSTNVYDFYNNKFKINKDIRRWNIEYQTKKVDEEGNVILLNNIPIFESKHFDIRGKKFKDLPEELKERFCDYTFQCTQYLNCSDEDIEYHICRYNEGVRLNGSEKGMGEIGTKYASMIKEIVSMPFFAELGGYKNSEFNNGTMNRVVAESIMAINFLDDWKKKPEEMCAYMKDKATEETFEEFTDLVEQLENVVTEEVCDMFDSKDSFLYFGLFSKFIKTGLNIEKFIEFMTELNSNQSLHTTEIDGVTYKSLCTDENGKTRSTKDKYIVIKKIELLEKLMLRFLHINKEKEISDCDIDVEESVETFVAECVEIDKEELHEDIEFYNQSLDELLESTVRLDSKLRHDENRSSLLAMMVYSYKKDVDLEEWLMKYATNNNTYLRNQKENYLHMVDDLKEFIQKTKRSA